MPIYQLSIIFHRYIAHPCSHPKPPAQAYHLITNSKTSGEAQVYPHQIFHLSGEAAPHSRGDLQGGAGQRDGGQGPPMGGRPCQVLPLA